MNALQIKFKEKVHEINKKSPRNIQSVMFEKRGRFTWVRFIRYGKEYFLQLSHAINLI